jgi:hypothetical protein
VELLKAELRNSPSLGVPNRVGTRRNRKSRHENANRTDRHPSHDRYRPCGRRPASAFRRRRAWYWRWRWWGPDVGAARGGRADSDDIDPCGRFFATSIALGLLARYGESPTDILDRVPAQVEQNQDGESSGNGILDQLGGQDEAPASSSEAPAEPAVPAVPNN